MAHLKPDRMYARMGWGSIGAILSIFILAACRAVEDAKTPPSPATSSEIGTPTVTVEPLSPASQPPVTSSPPGKTQSGYPAHRADGNRYVLGRGALPKDEPVDIPLAGAPVWLVAAPSGEKGLWVAALEDGHLQAFTVGKGETAPEVQEFDITPGRVPPGMPPLLQIVGGQPRVVIPPGDNFSPLTHPVALGSVEEGLAYVTTQGDVIVQQRAGATRLEVNALPDARLLVDDGGSILLLTGPTTRYDHGVLGDRIEAAEITLIETQPDARVALTIPIPEPSVIEGISPIWADITGDGVREIIVTLSDRSRGARLAVFNQNGERLATGPDIGQGYRWRNQMAMGPFSPQGSLEIVDVLTPHIHGVVEFFRLEGNRLEVAAQLPGYTSHVIGSRNLELALTGDFDGDGRPEVLVPDQARSQLSAIRHTDNGAQVVWSLPSGGTISANLAAIQFPTGEIALGIGRDDNTLRIWGP